jgi:hypothetical protein
MGNLWYKRVIRIWISQQWANGEQYLIGIHQLAVIINKSFWLWYHGSKVQRLLC